MAQVVSEAVLRARVEGEGDVKALNKAFQDLGKTSGKSASGVGDAMVSARARKAGLDAVGAALSGAAAGAGKAAAQPRLITRMRTAIGNLLGTAANSIRSGAQGMGGFARSVGSGIGTVASKVGQGVAAVARFGAAAGGIALRVTGVVAALGAVGAAMGGLVTVSGLFIGVLRSMTASFRWAVDEAAAAIETFGKMRRSGADWNTVENRSALAQRTIGDGWEEVNNRIIKTFTPAKMAKGLAGDKAVFARWGISPDKVAAAEKRLGRRMDVTDWLQRFASQREAFDAQIAKFGDKSPKQRAAIEKRRAQLDDDVTKMFGPAFAEGILKWSTADMRRILESQDRAGAVGPQNLPGETDEQMSDRRVQQAKDLQIALDEMSRTFGELQSRVAVGVQPAVTRLVEAWTQLAQSDASQKISDIVTAMANKGFDTVIAALNSFDPSAMTSRLQAFQDWISSFSTEGVGESLGRFATSLLDLPERLGNAATAIMDFIKAVNSIVESITTLGGLLKTQKEKDDIAAETARIEREQKGSAFSRLVGIDEPVPGYDRFGRRTPEGPPIPANLQEILNALSRPQVAAPVPVAALDQGMFDQIFDQGGSTLRSAASDAASSIGAGGSEAAANFNAGMSFAGAEAAGSRFGAAAVAIISAGVSGMRIGIAPGPVPSMVRAPAPSVGADSPVTP